MCDIKFLSKCLTLHAVCLIHNDSAACGFGYDVTAVTRARGSHLHHPHGCFLGERWLHLLRSISSAYACILSTLLQWSHLLSSINHNDSPGINTVISLLTQGPPVRSPGADVKARLVLLQGTCFQSWPWPCLSENCVYFYVIVSVLFDPNV